MSMDEFKVESSFPSRTKRSISTETQSMNPSLISDTARSGSPEKEDDEGLDLNDFLSSDIIYHSPYTDQEDTLLDTVFNRAPAAEEHYSFSKLSPSGSFLETTSSFNNLKWPEFSEWSLNVHDNGRQQVRPQRTDIRASLLANMPQLSMSYNEDDPLVFLRSQESKVLSSLNELLVKHSDFLLKGHGKVKKIRLVILDNLNQLHEIHQLMNEIYNSEHSKRLQILERFKEWEDKKTMLLAKINDIQSDSNEEGVRYRQLFDQSTEIDSEIEKLERNLKLLKLKRTVVRKELDSSQSIIESKASSYIESLEVVEQDEKNVIARLSTSDLKNRSGAIPNLQLPTNVSAPSPTMEFDSSGDAMSILNLSKLSISKFFNSNSNMDTNLQNHNSRMSKLFTELYKPRVDVSKVMDSLKLQIYSIADEVVKQELLSYKFQESSIIWNESITNVSNLEKFLKDNVNNNNEQFILKILQETLELLSKRLEISQNLQLSISQTAINNEITTIRKALYIITNDESYLDTSGATTPSSINSHKTSSHSSLNKNFINSPKSPSFLTLNTISMPTTTLATAGPPIILHTNTDDKKYSAYDNTKRKSVLGNLGFNKNQKSFKKD